MTETRRCNRCGNLLRSDAPAGASCPVCMLRAGLDASGEDLTFGFEPTQPGRVLESLARSIGPIPRVLLPDTATDDAGVGIIKPSSDEMPEPGERGVRYQLFGEIARGGMGAVLKGRDPDLGRDLAVKVLLESHHDKPELVRRFVEEAQIGGQLQHPGIVPVYELGAFADRRPYFTMKLVKGRTLSALLAERQSPAYDLPRFLGIFESICQTLAYAHARGVIHRDVKPSNVMVGNFGEVQVMDWGLAKVLKEGGVADEAAVQPAPEVSVIATVRSGSDVDESQAGSVLGTPAYMAPEQAVGEVERVDRRADVFGLGSILCEILSGGPVYAGRGSAEILRKAMRGDTADALGRLNGCGAEAELIGLAKDCLAVEAGERPRDAGVVTERMTAYLAGVQERVQAAERERAVAVARAIEERRRRKLQLGLAAAVLAFTTLGGLSSTYYLQERRRGRRRSSGSLARRSRFASRPWPTPRTFRAGRWHLRRLTRRMVRRMRGLGWWAYGRRSRRDLTRPGVIERYAIAWWISARPRPTTWMAQPQMPPTPRHSAMPGSILRAYRPRRPGRRSAHARRPPRWHWLPRSTTGRRCDAMGVYTSKRRRSSVKLCASPTLTRGATSCGPLWINLTSRPGWLDCKRWQERRSSMS